MKMHAEVKALQGPLRGGQQGATVTVEPLLTGEMQSPMAFMERAGGRLETLKMIGLGTPRSQWVWLPIPAYLVHHPGVGPIMIDTGLHPSVASKPRENLGRAISSFSHPRIAQGQDVPAQLRARGLESHQIPIVVMTHLHFDHASGMSEFSGATFVITEPEWTAATSDSRPFLRGYRPAHFDYVFDYRTLDYGGEGITSYGAFGRTFDLLGDGSIRLAFTPGHSAGHQSVILRLRDRDFVIAGDAIYTYAQLDDAPEPPRPVDRHNWRRSLRELKLFRREYPATIIVPGHDPQFWPQLEARYE